MADGLYMLRSNDCMFAYFNSFFIPSNVSCLYSMKLSLLRLAFHTNSILNPSFSGRFANEK